MEIIPASPASALLSEIEFEGEGLVAENLSNIADFYGNLPNWLSIRIGELSMSILVASGILIYSPVEFSSKSFSLTLEIPGEDKKRMYAALWNSRSGNTFFYDGASTQPLGSFEFSFDKKSYAVEAMYSICSKEEYWEDNYKKLSIEENLANDKAFIQRFSEYLKTVEAPLVLTNISESEISELNKFVQFYAAKTASLSSSNLLDSQSPLLRINSAENKDGVWEYTKPLFEKAVLSYKSGRRESYIKVYESEKSGYRSAGLHSFDGKPAVESDTEHFWFHKGLLHREIEPAAVYADGSKEWFQNGLRHRSDDLPAVQLFDGTCEWWVNGVRHRDSGKPAVVLPDGYKSFWENGEHIGSNQTSLFRNDL